MYERLPLDFIGITESYGQKPSRFHYGVDLGWHNYEGEPIYSVTDTEVVYEGFDNNLGNYIVLKHINDGNTIITRYLHMKNRTILKVGEKVKQKQVIGYMGKTGDTTGTHLHFEYWICPQNYVYNYADRSKYAKDPIKHCYLFEDQSSGESIKYLLKVLGNPVEKDTNNNQIKVINKYLNVRDGASLNNNILGYINLGYYNILEEKANDNYVWYKIGNNRWVAGTNDIEIYHKKEPEYNKFICKKDGTYYIKLKENEIIYYPKISK